MDITVPGKIVDVRKTVFLETICINKNQINTHIR